MLSESKPIVRDAIHKTLLYNISVRMQKVRLKDQNIIPVHVRSMIC